MPLTNVTLAGKVHQQVACLTCSSKVAISFAKDIYKTAFAQTGETLAHLVTKTLSLDAADNLPSSHLCLQCANYFGKLDLAERKVKSIKNEILKLYQDSLNLKENSINDTATPNAATVQANPICNLQVPTNFRKPKAVTRQQPVETVVTEQSSSVSNVSNHCCRQSNEEDAVNFDAGSIENNNEFDLSEPSSSSSSSSLSDHQYSLQSAKVNRKKLNASKLLPVLQQRNKVGRKSSAAVTAVPEYKKKVKIAKPKYYTCLYCDEKGKTLKELKQHQYKSHAELHSYICKMCSKVYKSQKALDVHMNLHNGISPFTCTICSKCFTQKSALKKHLSIHTTREEPYECRRICLKKSIYHSTYDMHTLTQNQEEMHKCNLCPLAFSNSWRLKRHTRIHTGDRQHKCEICDKRFYDRCSVVSHMKVHDPERIRLKEIKMKEKRPIQRRCERCNINFDSLGKYTVHLHSHTPENVVPYCKINYSRT